MKFIITEDRMVSFLSNYFNKIIEDSEFEWVDKISIEKTTTGGGGWRRESIKPLYVYNVYMKPEYFVKGIDRNKLMNNVSLIHRTLFPSDSNGPKAYYSVNFIE